MVIGSAVACYGAADRMLGALATVMRRWNDAERHLENALVLNRRLGSPTWIAHTRYERARLTLHRGRPHELELARERASEALDAARRIGLRGLVARIERLTASLPAATAADDLSPREVEVLRAVARGLSNREAAGVLHLSEHTVAHHLRSVLRKTGCANRAQATTYAVRHGIAET